MQFRAVLQLHGKTATGFQVPAEIVTALGSSKRPAVRVTLKGYTYRSSIAPMGGVFLLGVSAEHRSKAGVAAGDEVEVEVELDTEERVVQIPEDFAEALAANIPAQQAFERLAYSHKLQHVVAIEQAKTAETRQRRIAKALSVLLEGLTSPDKPTPAS
jgi:hypothetical protein